MLSIDQISGYYAYDQILVFGGKHLLLFILKCVIDKMR